jgi:hypothetical protein
VSPTTEFPFGTAAPRDLQYILSDNAAYVLVQYWEGSAQPKATAYKLDPPTFRILDSFPIDGGPYVQLTSATIGGGTQYTNHALGDTSEISYGALGGWTADAPRVQLAATSTTPETRWPKRRGIAGRRDGSNPRLGIFVKGQFVIAPFFHTSLRIVPRNQTRWARTPGFHLDSAGNWFLTIGAESSTNNCSGDLVSDLNRPSDLNTDILIYLERLPYPSNDEEAIVQRLLESDTNYTDSLAYACNPRRDDIFYNSNSYTHGLINRVELPSPVTTEVLRPVHLGWSKPVSADEFDLP